MFFGDERWVLGLGNVALAGARFLAEDGQHYIGVDGVVEFLGVDLGLWAGCPAHSAGRTVDF